jgi:hypothetical protein
MWEFASLPDAAVDVKVISGGNIWWHKGMTKHSVDAIFYVTPIPRTDQFLRNGGFEAATTAGAGPWTVTADVPVLDGWRAVSGAGSTTTLSRDTSVHAPDSTTSAKAIYSRVAGVFTLYQAPANPAAFRGKQVSFSVQMRQGVANNVSIRLTDSGGTTTSTTSATTGSFVTLTVTRTIDANATTLIAAIDIAGSDTVYIDNAIVNLGASPSTYQPEYWYPGAVTSDMLADGGVIAAKLAAGVAVANLGYTPVNRAGDTMSGTLNISGSGAGLVARNTDGAAGAIGIGALNAAASQWEFLVQHSGVTIALPLSVTSTGSFSSNLSTSGNLLVTGTGSFSNDLNTTRSYAPSTGYLFLGNAGQYLGWDGSKHSASGNGIWHEGNFAPSSKSDTSHTHPGIDAGTLDGIDSTGFLRLNAGAAQTVLLPGGGSARFGNNGDGWDMRVIGTFSATGTKSRIATGHDGSEGVFHANETPLPMFEEHGRARLVDGAAWVTIPRDFANYVDLTDYFVQVTAEGPTALYVTDRTPEGFGVWSLLGDTTTEFTWHLVARQGDMTHIERNLPLAEVPA